MLHDGTYDPIQGQGHETFKVRNSSISKSISIIYNGSWEILPAIFKLGDNIEMFGPNF